MNKIIELRIRTEEMLKFWVEFLAIILLGLFGAIWATYGIYKLIIGPVIIIVAIAMWIMFLYYNNYHKKTTNLIKETK